MGHVVKNSLALIFGGGIVHICLNYVGPFLLEHSEIVLPFSLSNSVCSAFWYCLAESALGVEGLLAMSPALSVGAFTMQLPLVGAAIGVLTAVTAPFLWPHAFKLCWSDDLSALVFREGPEWITSAYLEILLPVGLPVAILAGN